MMVEVKCPDCGKTHFFDLTITTAIKSKKYKNMEELTQILLENLQLNWVLSADIVEKNI